MTDKIRWGILGTGSIAKKFAEGLKNLPDAQLVAVGSRSLDSARTFADAFNVPHAHPTYESLAHDPDIDVVYIGTLNHLHADNALLCLDAGKAVLCEKPFALNAGETRRVVDVARARKLFLMEAMWTRYLPVVVKFRELIAEGAIGEPRVLFADFGFPNKPDPAHRLFNLSVGGGALLDVGVYPISLSSMVFGQPAQITGVAQIGPTGVDEQFSCILDGNAGQLSVLTASIRTRTPMEATLAGSDGFLRLHYPFWRPSRMTLTRPGKPDELFDLPFLGNGYAHEAAEVGERLRAGALESSVMPLDETLTIMQTLDALRAQWGLRFPAE